MSPTLPEHLVLLTGWMPGMLKVSLTKAIRTATGMDLASAKRCTDDVLAVLAFSTAGEAEEFRAAADQCGATAERETRHRWRPWTMRQYSDRRPGSGRSTPAARATTAEVPDGGLSFTVTAQRSFISSRRNFRSARTCASSSINSR